MDTQDKFLLFAIGLVVLCLMVTSCATPAPPGPVTPAQLGHSPCAANVVAKQEKICAGQYTSDGLLCVVCDQAQCLEQNTMVYCVWSCLDKACAFGGQ